MRASLERYVQTRRGAGLPPRGRGLGLPSPPPVGFTSIIGALADLNAMAEQWERRPSSVLGALGPPRVLLHPGETELPRGGSADMRVAVLEHPAGLSGAIGPALRELAAASGDSRVDVDAGYWLGPASYKKPETPQSGEAPLWTTTWNEDHLEVIQHFAAPVLPETVAGRASARREPGQAGRPERGRSRVLLIDTGDERAAHQDAFLVRQINTPDVPPRDWHGHGTSLGDLIRLRAPAATVAALRVFEPGSAYSASPALLAALNWALHPLSGADVVCVAQRAEISADHRAHADVIMSILRHAVAQGFPMPVVVCAAGNARRKGGQDLMALPATAPGVLAVRAVGWQGKPLDYNCQAPRGAAVNIAEAYGGEVDDPIGVTKAVPRPELWMVGTSYAAALVAGALADS